VTEHRSVAFIDAGFIDGAVGRDRDIQTREE
jgi:hypothetical protein